MSGLWSLWASQSADVSAVEVAWEAVKVVFVVTLMGVLLRWPGRILGFAAALVLWTVVGPWAFWSAIGVVVAAAVAWRRFRQGERLLVTHPELQLALIGAVVAVLFQGWVGLAGLVVALFVVVRLAWSWPPLIGRVSPAGVPAPAQAQPDDLPPAGAPGFRFLGGGAVVVDVADCERCGGTLAAVAQPPASGQELGVASAVCHSCGMRLVGILDPSAPAGEQVTWTEPEQWEQSA